jgi:hypothetical protein
VQITQLKIDHNPFAKGFRDNGQGKREKKRIMLNDHHHHHHHHSHLHHEDSDDSDICVDEMSNTTNPISTSKPDETPLHSLLLTAAAQAQAQHHHHHPLRHHPYAHPHQHYFPYRNYLFEQQQQQAAATALRLANHKRERDDDDDDDEQDNDADSTKRVKRERSNSAGATSTSSSSEEVPSSLNKCSKANSVSTNEEPIKPESIGMLNSNLTPQQLYWFLHGNGAPNPSLPPLPPNLSMSDWYETLLLQRRSAMPVPQMMQHPFSKLFARTLPPLLPIPRMPGISSSSSPPVPAAPLSSSSSSTSPK